MAECPFCKEEKKGGFLSACPHCGKVPSSEMGKGICCLAFLIPIVLIGLFVVFGSCS